MKTKSKRQTKVRTSKVKKLRTQKKSLSLHFYLYKKLFIIIKMRFLGGLYTVRVVNSAYKHNCSTSGYKYGSIYTNNTIWTNRNMIKSQYNNNSLTVEF